MDEQIINAMEICMVGYNCGACPYNVAHDRPCRKKLCADALDLISRQKAEIEKLKAEKQKMRWIMAEVNKYLVHAMTCSDTTETLDIEKGMAEEKNDR